MDAKFIEKANLIASDNISSSHQILRDMLDVLISFSEQNNSASDFAQDLKSLSSSISESQSQMAALINVCALLHSAADKLGSKEIVSYLRGLRHKVETVSKSVALQAAALIAEGRTYATISQSEFVLKTFEQASLANKLCTVFVMESRPLFEGRQTAKEITKMGHRAVLVSDAAIGSFIDEIDSAFVGADSILSDGTLINKIGTYPLAVCCAAAKKNFYVITSILKYDFGKNAVKFINKKEGAEEIYAGPETLEWTPPVEIRNFYFDRVGADLVTMILTEAGNISSSSSLAHLESRISELYGPPL